MEKRSQTMVKICGVQSPAEACAVLDLGADAVGVVVAADSPRRVSPATARSIAAVCDGRAVLVLRGGESDFRADIQSWAGPVQLHDPAVDLGRRFIHAGHLSMAKPPSQWIGQPCARLLDAPTAGSGTAWNWSAATDHACELPIILAGGLTADNVASAISIVMPWGVDVSSGVERTRGVKDLELVAAFIAAVRTCDVEAGRLLTPTPNGFRWLV